MKTITIDTADFKQVCIGSDERDDIILHMYLPEPEITEEQAANAARIVKTWNMHDEVIAVLEAAQRHINLFTPTNMVNPELNEIIQEMLDKDKSV